MRSFERVDTRLAIFVGGGVALLNALLVVGLTAFAIRESLEESDAWLRGYAQELAVQLAAGGLPEGERPPRSIVYRVVGEARSPDDVWLPAESVGWRHVSIWASLAASGDDYLVRRSRAGALRAEFALPLAHFVEERVELLRLAGIAVLAGALLSVGFGAVAARRALRPVRESFDRLAGFSADVSHELRTPINRVLNQAHLLLLEAPHPDAAARIASIHETAEQMRDLVNQLLLLASGEEGRLQPARDGVDLRATAAALVEFYRPLAEQRGQSLEVAGDGDAAAVCDRALVERALANLIENALVHGETGAKVRVVVERADDEVRLGVLDSGPGVAPADRERIFERFVRLDASRHGRGSGLGLPLARMIARLHGGELRVAASPLGGAALWLSLPTRPA